MASGVVITLGVSVCGVGLLGDTDRQGESSLERGRIVLTAKQK